jgi:hypothetical protein
MRDFRDSKAMAQSLRQALTAKAVSISHSDSLELVAKTFGLDNWNILAARIEAEANPPPPDTLFCSFCGKSQHEVPKLIAGPKVLICEPCVALCNDVIEHENVVALLRADQAASPDGAAYPTLTAFLRGRGADQLIAYVERAEAAIQRTRDSLHHAGFHLGEHPRDPGLPLPVPDLLEGRGRAEIAEIKAKAQASLSLSLRVLDVAKAVLAERG